MPPNQVPNPSQPTPMPKPGSSNDPYEFIMAPPVQTKKTLGLPGKSKKTFLIIGGAVTVMILLIVMLASLSGGSSEASLKLASLSAEQQEIIRVSDITLKLSKDSKTLATASTVKSSLTSEQQKTLELFAAQGGKPVKGQINSALNKAIEPALNTAAQSNTLSQAYAEYLQKSLTNYQKNLKALYALGGPQTQAFSEQAYNSSELILVSLK